MTTDNGALTVEAVEIEQGVAAGAARPMNNHLKICGLVGFMCAVVLITVSAVVLTTSKGGSGGDGGGADDDSDAQLNATGSVTLNCVPVVLEGHDMVEYFNIDAGSCGDPAIGLANYSYQLASADQNGDMRVYEFWFSSMVNQQTFASDPWKYVPKYGGFCAWGACCELPPHWPWAADHLGPPAGPDSANCGYEVYEGTLYFTIWQSYMNQFLADAEANIQAADERWISWFGSLQSGVFNFDCMSTAGWTFNQCQEDGQVLAPLLSSGVTESCGSAANA